MSEVKSETISKKGLIFNKTLYYALQIMCKICNL